LLSSLIEPLVTEKRLQFRSRSRVEIEAWLDASSYGIFAQVQPVEFKRLLSNLIDNSVDACANKPGVVSVNLSARDGRALVSVHDNGKGIPPDLLAKLGRRGETHGKEGGTGLGLYHARTSAESWHGSLEIISEVGQGTTITVNLPQALTPDWFVSELVPVPDRAFVILDDDESIHQVWHGRLDALQARERGIEIIHVSTPEEIRTWVKGNERKAREALYLLDFEFLGYLETGLSLAEELGIAEQAVLVTSRFEEPGILESCRKLKIRMIPKGLAGLVPIRVDGSAKAEAPMSECWNAVLIDDDPLVQMTWQVAAELAHKRLKVFASTEEFYPEAEKLDRGTPIYIDATLGNGSRGEDESRRIHSMGFSEIYLATGQKAGDFSAYVHLRGVVGKNPPWKS
jgi:anti-sigma regulatory factor (Ser/Thr protein kinase)